jgi:hypothetical protein
MPQQRQTLYDVLGVKRDAKVTDVGRAYNKIRSEMQKETAAPDKRRADLVQKAYETLSDPASRDAYDQSLVAPERKRHQAMAGGIAVGVAVVIAGGYFAFLPPPPAKAPPPPAAADILHAASLAVGGLKRIDMSGQTTHVGAAFALQQGVMVTTCHEIGPGSQLVVHISPRDVPARITTADDARGLCQLAVEGVGSKPLSLSGLSPKAGDKIYSTKINAVGEVALIEGTVKKVSEEPVGRVVEASMPVASSGAGGPLLDAYGRVLGVALRLQPDDRGRFVAIPTSWAEEPREYRSAPQAPARASEPKPAPTFGPVPKSVDDIPQERKDQIEKAFRPPPNVPNDL